MLLSAGFTRTRSKLRVLYKCVRVAEKFYLPFFFGSDGVSFVPCVVLTLGILISPVCWIIFLFSVFCLVFSFFGFFVVVFCLVFVFQGFWLLFIIFGFPKFPVERGAVRVLYIQTFFYNSLLVFVFLPFRIGFVFVLESFRGLGFCPFYVFGCVFCFSGLWLSEKFYMRLFVFI